MDFLKKYINNIPNAKATLNPRTGETTRNVNTFCIPPKTNASKPPKINAEPIKPPISAWLLDAGKPKYHVIKSHTIAPINQAKITSAVEKSGCIIPLPTVAAIAVPKTNGPIKLAKAAILTA